MTSTFPGTADVFGAPSGAGYQSLPVGGRTHSQSHTDLGDAIENTEGAVLTGVGARVGWTLGLADALAEGVESAALCVNGDSTGYTAGKTRWTDLLATWFATNYPTYGVQTVRFDDTTQVYLPPTVVQALPSGQRYVTPNGVSLTNVGDGTVLNGQIECEIDLTFNNPGNAVITSLVSRYGAAGTRQFQWTIQAGFMRLVVSADGTSLLSNYTSTVAPFYPTAGQRVRYRLQFNPVTGGNSTAAFFYSTNGGTSFTQIGATWTNAFNVTLNQSNLVGYEAGGVTGGTSALDGSIYGVWIRNGFLSNSGVTVVPSSPDLWPSWTSTPTVGGSPMLTLVNGSVPGKGIAYFNASAARVTAMNSPEWGTRALVLNCGHLDTADVGANSSSMTGYLYTAQWDAWLTALRVKMPDTPIVVTIQNPRTAPAVSIDAHRSRARALRQWASRNNLGLLDVRRAFLESGQSLAALVDSVDGIHPTDAAGSPLWATLVEAQLKLRA